MNITLEDFQKIDLRIAKVKDAHMHPDSRKMIVLKLDLGDEEKQVLAGVKQWYTEEDLIGKTVVFVANLEPKVIGGVESQGMILAADASEKPLFLTVDEDCPLNAKIK